VVGSHAYGTAREGSDLDVRAVAIPPYTLGVRSFDAIATPEGAPTDEHVYGLRRFVHLAAGASVPILELLFAPEDCIVEESALLREHVRCARDVFLTRRLYASVGGYAFSTAQRAFEGKVHKGREHLLERFGYDTKAVMHAVRLWRMGATALREGMLVVRRPDAAELLQIRDGAIPHADVAVFEAATSSAGSWRASATRSKGPTGRRHCQTRRTRSTFRNCSATCTATLQLALKSQRSRRDAAARHRRAERGRESKLTRFAV
jgi:hypothetical protein